jgi:hypothetical protein
MIHEKQNGKVNALIADAGGKISNRILETVITVFLFYAVHNFQ